ncbi:unnamed protein product [Rangifer tarandus platyrhynchus]|uniref:Uncharacterized protein n=2 Tax=Rangifer tarandus platyrhynchus TaxID=3082113 RepID=A0ACB0F6X4_RANTA|nr:unnamed protein product [Rangifer tarandus platyrhynchus]CAI9708686.1 unnamed protein product [Rangifer tarandus platyrhynchus]
MGRRIRKGSFFAADSGAQEATALRGRGTAAREQPPPATTRESPAAPLLRALHSTQNAPVAARIGSPGVTPCTITGEGPPPACPHPARVTVRWAGRTQDGQEQPASHLTLGQERSELPVLLTPGRHRRAIHHPQLPGE